MGKSPPSSVAHIKELPKLSRGDVEVLCVLYVVGEAGCPVNQVAQRLGLSPSIAAQVAEGMSSLVDSGLLVQEGDRFSLTPMGRQRLDARAGHSAGFGDWL
jgi:DNA-binding IclR family transcriptional regulator